MTPEQRYRCMSRIRSKDTGPEWRVRRMVHAMGFRYRLHAKELPGRPDLVLPRHHKIIFVHGCFWHAHGCRAAQRPPATHARFWKNKFARNVARDQEALRLLWQAGWQVLVIWECETREPEQLRALLSAFLAPTGQALAYGRAGRSADYAYGRAAETPGGYGKQREALQPRPCS